MCGTANKVESVFCSSCGARLVPLTAAPEAEKVQPAVPIKGLSLPAKHVEPPAKVEPPSSAAGQPSAEDWLERLRTTTPPAEETAPTLKPESLAVEPPPAPDQTPDWLARLRMAQPADEPTTDASAAPILDSSIKEESPSDTPDWLKGAPPARGSASPSDDTPDETPDWLKRLRDEPTREESAPTEAIGAQEESSPTIGEIPDWLKRLPRTEATPIEPAPLTPPAPVTPPAVPLPPIGQSVEPTPEPIAPTPVDEPAIPDWLETLKPPVEPASTPVAAKESPNDLLLESLESDVPFVAPPLDSQVPAWALEAPMTESSDDDDLPDWLRGPAPASTGEPASTESAPPALQPALPEEVPAWVAALKPAETSDAVQEQTELTGPLEGLRGVLPLALAIAEPHAFPTTKSATSTTASEHARAFEAILAAPAVTTAPVAAKTRRAWTMRPLIYLFMFIAVVLPFFVKFDLFGAAVPITGHVPAEDFVQVVHKLPAGATVVLAFDYDPGMSGEMDLLATTIARDLVSRNVNIVAVSTHETGPQIAQRVLTTVAQDASNYTYGTHYVILNWIAGHEAGLSAFASRGFTGNDVKGQALGKYPVTANLKSLRDVKLVIELAGSENDLKLWLEQVALPSNVPMAAGVSAAVEPKARAYRDANQLIAITSGLLGAAQYELLSNQSASLAVTSVDAQTAAQLVFVFVIILGNLVYLTRRLQHAQDKTK